MVKRLRHRPFTAVTGVQIPLESLRNSCADVAQFSRNKDCVHDGNIRRTNACINVRLMFSSYRRLHRERENKVFERHAIRFNTPMWLNWQSSWFVISRLTVRVPAGPLIVIIHDCNDIRRMKPTRLWEILMKTNPAQPVRTGENKPKAWDLSSAGRASALQAGGHRFEPCRSHLYN